MISIIAAIGKNRELGYNNKLLWDIATDMKRFKRLTTDNVVVMGRKTYESLPEKFRPLPKRINIVVTRDKGYIANGAIICNSIEDALKEAEKFNKEIFIIGGAQIYSLGIKHADKLYLTQVEREYPQADAFFPDYSDFKNKISEEKHPENDPPYIFAEYIK